MKIIATALLMLTCTSGIALAQQAPATAPAPAIPSVAPADRPTEASVQQLLQVQNSKHLVEVMNKQLDTMFTNIINQQLQGKNLTDEDKQRVAAGRERLNEIRNKIFTWETMEPMFTKIYSESFSQAEVDSMIAFYSSPAGQSIVAKLPLVAQNTMVNMQEQMKSLVPQIQQIAKDTATAINTQHEKSDKHTSG
jgi:hypothetical protein